MGQRTFRRNTELRPHEISKVRTGKCKFCGRNFNYPDDWAGSKDHCGVCAEGVKAHQKRTYYEQQAKVGSLVRSICGYSGCGKAIYSQKPRSFCGDKCHTAHQALKKNGAVNGFSIPKDLHEPVTPAQVVSESQKQDKPIQPAVLKGGVVDAKTSASVETKPSSDAMVKRKCPCCQRDFMCISRGPASVRKYCEMCSSLGAPARERVREAVAVGGNVLEAAQPFRTRKCSSCGKDYVAVNAVQKRCDACRDKIAAEKGTRKAVRLVNCFVCNKPLVDRQRLYCSSACRFKANNKFNNQKIGTAKGTSITVRAVAVKKTEEKARNDSKNGAAIDTLRQALDAAVEASKGIDEAISASFKRGYDDGFDKGKLAVVKADSSAQEEAAYKRGQAEAFARCKEQAKHSHRAGFEEGYDAARRDVDWEDKKRCAEAGVTVYAREFENPSQALDGVVEIFEKLNQTCGVSVIIRGKESK